MSNWNKLTTVTYDGSGEISFNTSKLGNFAIGKQAGPKGEYLCFTAEEAINIKWNLDGTFTNTPSIQYSLNDTSNWQEYSFGTDIALNTNQKCYWKGTTNTFSESMYNYITFSSTGKVAASGDVDSLINWAPLTDWCYSSMFLACTSLTAAPALPATTLADGCYCYMFYGCKSLTTAPALPATTLAGYCYNRMFYNCESLTTAPALPATTLAGGCCTAMFNGCTSLYVSDTSGEGYDKEWRMPTTGTFTNTYNQGEMFAWCKGTRSSDNMAGEAGQSYVYYTQNTPV